MKGLALGHCLIVSGVRASVRDVEMARRAFAKCVEPAVQHRDIALFVRDLICQRI
ncbi:hypothetical protein [Actinopolymorpha pittospori]|uniref:Uncharacterized protein n=1 Tax=Actinopolymorpha pittospori TaxID=648752 RepID=A0A927RAA0_9ACTN|nr:hypothetical protein [Actinopolymorpha pittospori]MBE1608747.1 hypothetical protein [Actinopolymorpha pittospori]